MNQDLPHRMFRLIEALTPQELTRGGFHSLVDGWLEEAERAAPGKDKALLEGDCVVRLADGSEFKEVSFKTEHSSVGEALSSWSEQAGRRWARFDGHALQVSDGSMVERPGFTIERS